MEIKNYLFCRKHQTNNNSTTQIRPRRFCSLNFIQYFAVNTSNFQKIYTAQVLTEIQYNHKIDFHNNRINVMEIQHTKESYDFITNRFEVKFSLPCCCNLSAGRNLLPHPATMPVPIIPNGRGIVCGSCGGGDGRCVGTEHKVGG